MSTSSATSGISPVRRRRVAALSALAAAALAATGLASGSAGASEHSPGAAPTLLSANQRADMLRDAQADSARTADALGLGAKEKLVVKDVVRDVDGTVHTRYERSYASLPVLGGDLVVHRSDSGKITGVTKATDAHISLSSTTPKLAKATAGDQARRTATAEGATKPDTTTRTVVWAADGKPVLAYEAVVGGLQKDGTPNELHVITNADTGKKLFSYQGVEQGVGHSEYSGDVELGTAREGGGYTLKDTERGDSETLDLNHGAGNGQAFTDDDDVWGDGTAGDPQTAAVDAHYGAALTWDYYRDVHGRDGIAGDGKGATSRVHYSNNYSNAFWQDSCFCMTYGDGAGNAHPLTSVDVAAHEMSHGVTSTTANLTYSGESGGLNEATSDIFAAGVEFYADNPEDPGDYLVGEKIDLNGDGSPLRYMDEPSKDGISEDYWYDGIDWVDVHYSSGVANHFFYLLSEGSGKKEVNGVQYDSPTSNDSTVEGIGRDKAEQIWFKALTTYMTSSTDYHDAREATLQAATDLYGADSAEVEGVDAAWAGVNVS